MAEGHISKGSGGPRFNEFIVFEDCVNLLTDSQMIGIRFAVDQIGPVEIAFRSPFPASKGTKHYKTCVFGSVVRNLRRQERVELPFF